MKKLMLAAVMCLVAAGAQAAQNEAGCGLGSQVFKQNDKGHQILAATTNGSFGTQTFGISSETSGCNPGKTWWSMRRNEQEKFVRANIRDLSREMASGNGEYVSSLSALLGCSSSANFGHFAQSRYEALFPSSNTAPEAMLQNLRQELSRDAGMSSSCSAI